jgi:hypothetical protein
MVTEQRAAGYDLLKIHPGLTREVYDAVVATAGREGIRFGGHVPSDVGLTRALLSGQSSVDHLDGYIETLVRDGAAVSGLAPGFFGLGLIDHLDEARIAAVAAATRAASVWNVPTLVLAENWFGETPPEETARRPEMRFMPEKMVSDWVQSTRKTLRDTPNYSAERGRRFVALRRRLVRALRDAGAGILLGADTPQVFNVPGFATLQELEALVASGLTPFEALSAGTRHPALYFDKGDAFGTVEAGKRADLLLLDASPLADVGNVRRRAGVMAAGRWLPVEELDRMLEAYRTGPPSPPSP